MLSFYKKIRTARSVEESSPAGSEAEAEAPPAAAEAPPAAAEAPPAEPAALPPVIRQIAGVGRLLGRLGRAILSPGVQVARQPFIQAGRAVQVTRRLIRAMGSGIRSIGRFGAVPPPVPNQLAPWTNNLQEEGESVTQEEISKFLARLKSIKGQLKRREKRLDSVARQAYGQLRKVKAGLEESLRQDVRRAEKPVLEKLIAIEQGKLDSIDEQLKSLREKAVRVKERVAKAATTIEQIEPAYTTTTEKPETKTEETAEELTLADDTKIKVRKAGEKLAVGDKVFQDDGTTALEDSTYTLQDKVTRLTVASGAISKIETETKKAKTIETATTARADTTGTAVEAVASSEKSHLETAESPTEQPRKRRRAFGAKFIGKRIS